ncbi:hypothetical protein KY342_00705 [Candidatus Woesearchaeota archaeon]|nr:hypothetical protein [Candidatus Woesearchaeota archaeon]
MELGKRGVFFTFIAFIFLSLLIFSLSIGNNYKMRQTSFVVETRVDTMNRFIVDIEKDIERGAYIAGIRAFFELGDYIISTGEYISDLDLSFSELFINGTIDGENSSIMVNNTFTDWIDRIEDEASEIDIIINFTINDISLYQEDHWEVTVDINLTIDMHDKKATSSWKKLKSIKSIINIDGFEDPVYWVETNGIVENGITKTNFSYFVTGMDISNLLSHAYNGFYVEFSGAPDYLMRLEGNLSGSSVYGIESLVDIDRLKDEGVPSKDINQKSIVDYIYFGVDNPQRYQVTGAPGWFKVDNSSNMYGNQTHHDLYEINGLI